VDVTFGILGSTAIRIGGTLDERWGPPRERAVLAPLLINAGRPVTVGTLVEWVWPDRTPVPRSPVPTFYTYATRIRKTLRRLDPPVSLVVESGSYRLDVDRSQVDYHRFQSLLGEARQLRRRGLPRHAATTVQRALDLWRGEPLDELRSEPAQHWRAQAWAGEWLPANAMLIEILLELGQLEDALARLGGLQAAHPSEPSLMTLGLTALHSRASDLETRAYYFSARRQLLEYGDGQAAEHLRAFYEKLTAPAMVTAPYGRPWSLSPR
jgi:DNA-binding SARP family transcriptional activator